MYTHVVLSVLESKTTLVIFYYFCYFLWFLMNLALCSFLIETVIDFVRKLNLTELKFMLMLLLIGERDVSVLLGKWRRTRDF